MSIVTRQQQMSLIAFITALGQQDKALPPSLQKQLHAIGKNLEHRVAELPTIAASLPELHQSYQSALANERAVSDGQNTAPAQSVQTTELINDASQIFTHADPVKAAQRESSNRSNHGTNPLKRLFRRS